MNIRLDIEYDGTDFHGWQRQPGLPTVQAILEDTIESAMGFKTTVMGASRTDSGVHARGQVAHFEAESKVEAERWCSLLNVRLPRPIRIQKSREVPSSFHAQKDAVSKIYEYRILNRKNASALDRRVHFYPRALDWSAIRLSLPHFVGERDFAAFQCAKADVKTTVRRITRFELEEEEPGLYRFVVEGNGFLKQMVRTMIGTILEVGEGKRRPESIADLIGLKNRKLAGRTAPASGLCLVEVRY